MTDFDGTNLGVVSFYNVITGGETCSEDIIDNGPSTVGSVTIPTTFVSINASDLSWTYSEEQEILEIEYYADFNGSNESATCNGACYCSAIFTN